MSQRAALDHSYNQHSQIVDYVKKKLCSDNCQCNFVSVSRESFVNLSCFEESLIYYIGKIHFIE